MAEINTSDPDVTPLTGSSPPTGAAPLFEPITDIAYVDADPVFLVIATHRAAYAAWLATCVDGNLPDLAPEEKVESAALRAVVDARPTTVPGLRTWTEYLAEYVERDGDFQVAEEALPGIARAARDLLPAATMRIGPNNEAELLKVGERLQDVRAKLPVLKVERKRLSEVLLANLPPVPAGLIVDPAAPFGVDIEYFTAWIEYGETRYYTEKAIDRLRRIPRMKELRHSLPPEYGEGAVRIERVADPEAQARVETVLAAWGEWRTLCSAREDASGYSAVEEEVTILEELYVDLFAEVYSAIPMTLKGLAVQLRAMIYHPLGDVLTTLVVDRLDEFAKAGEGLVLASGVQPSALVERAA